MASETKPKSPKSPNTAALLNAFPLIFGLGYLYMGRIGRFVVVLAIQLFSALPMEIAGLGQYNRYLLLVVWIVSMVDVYGLAQERNKSFSADYAP